MEYSALRLETLALMQQVIKASLPTVALSPIAKVEVASWNQLKGCYRVVDQKGDEKVQVQTKEGEEATDDQWTLAT